VHCPWTTTRRLRVWVYWQSLQVEYTGSFLVFNRACLLASTCPTRAIPAFGPGFSKVSSARALHNMSCFRSWFTKLETKLHADCSLESPIYVQNYIPLPSCKKCILSIISSVVTEAFL
jgi:hypothetical protein